MAFGVGVTTLDREGQARGPGDRPGAGHRTRPGSRQETAGRLGLARSDRAALGVEGAEK